MRSAAALVVRLMGSSFEALAANDAAVENTSGAPAEALRMLRREVLVMETTPENQSRILPPVYVPPGRLANVRAILAGRPLSPWEGTMRKSSLMVGALTLALFAP